MSCVPLGHINNKYALQPSSLRVETRYVRISNPWGWLLTVEKESKNRSSVKKVSRNEGLAKLRRTDSMRLSVVLLSLSPPFFRARSRRIGCTGNC
jgi:hypothetical protein